MSFAFVITNLSGKGNRRFISIVSELFPEKIKEMGNEKKTICQFVLYAACGRSYRSGGMHGGSI